MCAKRYEVQAPLVPHDDLLPPPDELTDLFINHIWRRFIGDLLVHFSGRVDFVGSDAEIEQAQNWYDELILDFYTEDPVLKIAARLKHVDPFVTIPAATNFVVEFEDPALGPENYDYGGFWDAGNPGVLTIPVNRGGIYLFSANIRYLISPPDVLRKQTILINGSDNVAVGETVMTGKLAIHIAGDAEVEAGDTIMLNLWSAVADFAIINFSLHRLFK